MLKRTPPEALQEDQEQESGFRRLIRTFDPEVPGYVFWPVLFGVGVIFQQAVLRGFGVALEHRRPHCRECPSRSRSPSQPVPLPPAFLASAACRALFGTLSARR